MNTGLKLHDVNVTPLASAVDEALRLLRSWRKIKFLDNLSQVKKSIFTAVVALGLVTAKNMPRGIGIPKLAICNGKLRDAIVYLRELTSGLSEVCYTLPGGCQLLVTGEKCHICPCHLILANHTESGGTMTFVSRVDRESNPYGIGYFFPKVPGNTPLQEVDVVVREAKPRRLDPDALEKILQHLVTAA